MKTLKMTGAVLLGLALLLSLGVMSVSADAPAGTNPVNAPYIDNQVHIIPANGSVWYRFDYGPTDTSARPVATIVLPLGNKLGLSFEIWDPINVQDWWEKTPIGRGTPTSGPCSTDPTTTCKSDDLVWSGGFGTTGTYFVHVIDNTASPISAMLTIKGDGVALAPARVPAAAPALAATAINMDDPGRATLIDNKPHSIPANSAMWFSFNYAGTDTNPKPNVMITLVNGANSGVNFQVWSAQNLNDWWDQKPVGQGTAASVNCDIGGAAGNTGCQSSDLTWVGSFGNTGTYYVRVVNSTNAPMNFVLTIQ
jgi:hypothetical protein